ncbi:hypothetical protein BDA99DRAFT_576691 [Phascolomyces articulosus]|uniref:F-box domain-containing protein n=1 Tax=Phascolomyces articulosus TaxID=60185 RepID=A0AAD5JN30_9FUNG|nr:hypothetical protein BDA99DRAFT_576691 [Phascolomyces articulosus]
MAIFQQVKNNAYDALPESRFIKRDLASRQRKAEKLIHKSPQIAKGYLGLAKVYTERNNLRAAIEVYNNGIDCISSSLHSSHSNNTTQQKTKTLQQLLLLQKHTEKIDHVAQKRQDLIILRREKQNVLATLVQHSRQFAESIPYEILYKIFGYLQDFKDLRECANVCKQWRRFMITFPRFWSTMSSDEPTNQSFRKFQCRVIVTDTQKLTHIVRLGKEYPWGIQPIKYVFDILLHATDDYHGIEKLCFDNVKLRRRDDVDLLAKVLKNMKSPPFKKIEFINCDLPDTAIIAPILQACSNLTHVTYKENYYPWKNYEKGSVRYFRTPPPFETFLLLTYLRFYIGGSVYLKTNPDTFESELFIGDILTRCPNLMHLFLDAREARIDFGLSAATVFQHCPRLRNLILGNNAEMPNTILSDIDDSEYYHDINDNCGITTTNQNPQPIDQSINISSSSSKNTTEHDATHDNINLTNNIDDEQLSINTKMVSSSNHKKKTHQQSLQLPSTASKLLRRFVILNSYLSEPNKYERDTSFQWANKSSWENCFSIFNMLSRDSLELLYIPYCKITANGLHQWCQGGVAPNLRELHIDGYALPSSDNNSKLSFQNNKNILEKIFPCVPHLEALFIQQPTSSIINDSEKTEYRYAWPVLFINNNTLKHLIKHCRRLHHLTIIGHASYNSKGVLLLTEENANSSECPKKSALSDSPSSAATKLPITYLEMKIPQDIILPLVKGMNFLKELHVHSYYNSNNNIRNLNPSEDQRKAEAILHERGGSLNFPSESSQPLYGQIRATDYDVYNILS